MASEYTKAALDDFSKNLGLYGKNIILILLIFIAIIIFLQLIGSNMDPIIAYIVYSIILVLISTYLWFGFYYSLIEEKDLLTGLREAMNYLIEYIIGSIKSWIGLVILLSPLVLAVSIIILLLIYFVFGIDEFDLKTYFFVILGAFIILYYPYHIISSFLVVSMIMQIIKTRKFKLRKTMRKFFSFLKDLNWDLLVYFIMGIVIYLVPVVGFFGIPLFSVFLALVVKNWMLKNWSFN